MNNFYYHDLQSEVKIIKPDSIKKAKALGLTSSRFKNQEMSNSTKQIIQDAKKRDRTYMDLDEWGKSKYYQTNWCKLLKENCPDQIERINFQQISTDFFIQNYEKQAKPCVITNTTNHLEVEKYWTFGQLYERYKDVKFKIGEDDKGKKIRVELKYFLEYLVHNTDDSPLYMFESAIEDIKEAKKMIEKYEVPKFFKEDIFQYIGEKKRPPYRWFLVGPERSGTTVHIDPLWTSAWNTSFQGYKRWILFKPEVPKFIVKGKKYIPEGEDDDAIQYFTKILPQLIKEEGREKLGVIEFIQNPGETVFIPGGWWHAVINVTDTIAVTQNFMSSNNYTVVWRSLREERQKLAQYAIKKFKQRVPKMYDKIIELNRKDNHLMYYEKKKLRKKNMKKMNNFLNIIQRSLLILQKKTQIFKQ
ncbi:jumonji domain protein [Ichthyophthirius multifiliis]|uniref:Jumonji domain protein n=1 Tax=Ichthyophthirius multifiliis TaxID=5932 RepID=G0QU68_ICHMU|nr:jumonji domain protein [Ichthyophthirius multifiliis]EGR31249.1 jumonji domain protein [Ichthyophthirius multifiliis]|eukprot:XP_004034735.1 jumonji domain protein [Ichthyophthirius multifiliis]